MEVVGSQQQAQAEEAAGLVGLPQGRLQESNLKRSGLVGGLATSLCHSKYSITIKSGSERRLTYHCFLSVAPQ